MGTVTQGVAGDVIAPRARRIGDIVYMKGQADTSADVPVNTTIATLPSSVMFPSTITTSLVWVSNGAAAMFISTAGEISLSAMWALSYTCEFGGVFYGV